MAISRETIDHVTLSHLVEANAVNGACVIGQGGGWGVVIKYGMTERALASKRGQVRNFSKFETLVGYLKKIGVAKYQVDATGYDPVARKNTRRSEVAHDRMKAAHEAAAYDKWFRAQVQEAIDDPRPSIPHELVAAEWKKERAELLKQAESAGA